MYGLNKIRRDDDLETAESLFAKLMEVLEDARDDGDERAEKIQFALQCADFEAKLSKFIVEQRISQRVLIAVLSCAVANQVKLCPHRPSAQKQVFDTMSRIINT